MLSRRNSFGVTCPSVLPSVRNWTELSRTCTGLPSPGTLLQGPRASSAAAEISSGLTTNHSSALSSGKEGISLKRRRRREFLEHGCDMLFFCDFTISRDINVLPSYPKSAY